MKQFRFAQEKQTIQKVPVYATPSFFYGHKGAFWGNRNVLKLDCIKDCIIINLPKPLILCFQWLNFMIYKWSFNKPVKYILKNFFLDCLKVNWKVLPLYSACLITEPYYYGYYCVLQIDGGKMETVTDFIFLGSKITANDHCSHEIKMLASWKKSCDKPRQHIKKQRHHFADQGPSSQSCGFSSSCVYVRVGP